MNSKVEEALENGGKPKIGTGNRAQRRANERLSKEAHMVCVNLCTLYLKTAAKENLTFDSQEALDLFNTHEAKWHAWLNQKCDRSKISMETKRMFQTYLLRYIDRINTLKKAHEETTKVKERKPRIKKPKHDK